MFFTRLPSLLAHRRPSPASKGFTLMELLVVMTIFSTVVMIASDVFVISARTQRKVYGLERAQADARYTIEAITREVRTGNIDFAYYAGNGGLTTGPLDTLALTQSDGTAIRFTTSSSATQCGTANNTPCMTVVVGSGAASTITPKNVVVNNAKFYVTPATDPSVLNVATGLYASDVQPRVTVVLVLKSTGGAVEEQSVVYLQTTAVTRSYKR